MYLPEEAWRSSWLLADGTPKYNLLVVRLVTTLYGHLDTGTSIVILLCDGKNFAE